MKNKIEVIGIGLEGISGLTEETRILIEKATVLVGSDRHLQFFSNHLAEKLVLGDFLVVFETMRRRLKQEEKIVVFVSGDPLFFGLGRLLVENFPPEQLNFHPHLSSVQLAFSRLQLPWHDAKIISVHGRSLNLLIPLLQKGFKKIAILTDQENNPAAIAQFYQQLDLPATYQFWICERLGAIDEKVYSALPEEISLLTNQDFSPLNIVILVRKNVLDLVEFDAEKLPLFGLPDSSFYSFEDRPGLMTKREVRMMVLGELALQPKQIIWDIGAGTGSVSIEIARLCPNSKIYAIEKTAMGIVLIERNSQRFRVDNVYAIQGKAPEILADLPTPDRIFIGGSGGKLTQVLNFCQAKIGKQGKVVLALATLEHIALCLNWFKEHQWNYSFQEIHISRSLPIAELTRLHPLNPVMLIEATPFFGVINSNVNEDGMSQE